MLRSWFALFLFSLLVAPAFAQDGTWDYYVPARPINGDGPSIVRDGDATWVAAQGGGSGGVEGALIRHDRRTGRVTTLTPFNSGLPSGHIAALALGAEGALWVGIPWLEGGNGAVARFHEGTWTVYDATNTPELQGEVTTLHVDAAGTLWVGTYGGILRFDGTDWTAYTTENSDFPLSYVRAIDSDESGVLWAGGWGLARFDGTGWTAWTTENSDLPNDGMLTLAVTGPDEVWAGTQQEGLVHLDAGEVTIYTRDEWPMSTIRPDRLVAAPDGSVWGTAGNLFRIVDDILLEVETEDFDVSRSFVIDGDELWSWFRIVDDNLLGYVEVAGGTVSAPTTFTLGPNDTWIPAVAWGPDSALYFGTQGRGVGRFDGRDWTHWHPYWTDGLPDGSTGDLAFDRDGGLWAAPYGGAPARFDGETWTEYAEGLPTDLSGARAVAVVPQPDGSETVWAALERWGEAGQGAALARLDGTTWEWLTPSGVDLFSTYIRAIAGGADGTVWLATRDLGVVRTDGETATAYTSTDDGLPMNYITDVAVDAAGTVWATSPYGSLVRFDGSTWSVVSASTTGVTEPASVAADPRGGVWVGGASATARFDGEAWTTFNSQNAPLPPTDDEGGFPFVSIAPNPDGRVAFGTAFRGLFLYTPAGGVPTEDDAAAPMALRLEQSFPNPTSDVATIRFHVPPPASAPVRLDVLDVLGRRVTTLVAETLPPGSHEARFDAAGLPAGIYLVRLVTGASTATRRLTVLR